MKDYLVGKKHTDNFVYYSLSQIKSLEDALEKTKEYVIEREYETKKEKIESKLTGFTLEFDKRCKLLNENIFSKNGSFIEGFREYIPNKVKIVRGDISSFSMNIEEESKFIFESFDGLNDSLKKIISKKEMEGSTLFLTSVILSSGSQSLKENEVYLSGDTININIDVLCPEIGTDDIANYVIFVLIPNSFIVDKEKYIFRCVEKIIL